jgi:hypothetical protein
VSAVALAEVLHGHVLKGQVLLADDDKGRGSPIGLFVILALCVAVYFLWKSLNRHLKKLPESFDQPRSGGRAASEARTSASDGGDGGPQSTAEPEAAPRQDGQTRESGEADH